MSHPIRFRVWDKQRKEFLQQDDEKPYHFWSLGRDWNLSDIYENPERFIVQISTGYLDDNKKLIFEGDIVKTQSFKYPTNIHEIIVEIPRVYDNFALCGFSKHIIGHIFSKSS